MRWMPPNRQFWGRLSPSTPLCGSWSQDHHPRSLNICRRRPSIRQEVNQAPIVNICTPSESTAWGERYFSVPTAGSRFGEPVARIARIARVPGARRDHHTGSGRADVADDSRPSNGLADDQPASLPPTLWQTSSRAGHGPIPDYVPTLQSRRPVLSSEVPIPPLRPLAPYADLDIFIVPWWPPSQSPSCAGSPHPGTRARGLPCRRSANRTNTS